MYKFLRYLIIFGIVFLFSGCANMNRFEKIEFSESKKIIEILPPQDNILVGEKLTYNVYWTGIYAGKIVLHVKEKKEFNDSKAFHIVAETFPSKLIFLIYRTKDIYHSYIDDETFYSHGYKLIREGKINEKVEVVYDYKNLKANIHDFNDGEENIDIPAEVHDSLSCLYYLRTRDIEVGDDIAMNVNADKKNWELNCKIKEFGRSNIMGLGKFYSFMVIPKIKYKGEYRKDREIKIWISSDEKKVPLLININVPLGYIRVVLQDIEYGT